MKKLCIYMFIMIFSATGSFAKNIVILATGGTIAGAGASSTQMVGYKAGSIGVDKIVQSVPELSNIKGANITSEQVLQIDSSDMNNEAWLKLAKRVSQLVKSNDVDGIVITHGTDTMEETSYFLNLVIRTNKPIVFVGSMRPSTAISADGPMNLYNAVLVANSNSAKAKGVMVVINDTIFDARNVTKTNNYRVDAFSSPNSGEIGFVHDNKVEFNKVSAKTYGTKSEFDINNIKELPNVDIISASAGATTTYVEAARKAKIDAIIYAATGNGTVPTAVSKSLEGAVKDGIIVVRASRIFQGHVGRGTDDDTKGFIASYDLNPQKARILMMLGLTKSKDKKYLQSLFSKY